MEKDKVDVTQPGIRQSPDIGRRHPISMTMEKAVDIYTSLGYDDITSIKNSPEN
jgi:phenylalanyl-tRNA synthetase alpha subunit